MRINHNITALNTYRQLSSNGAQSSKNLEKLSSGLRINRAGDDAAGLAISEKMRGQIRGLDQATRNSQDAISMMQTAEGALNETHSILQRMKELATQAANDTYNSNDRTEIQKEINQLTSEINRIGNTTEFNTRKLLNGEISAQSGVVTTGALTAGATTLTNLTLDKKSSLEAGNYSVVVADTTTNTASATHTATADITDVSISASSALALGNYQVAIDQTQVKTVAPTAIDNGISSVSINPLASATDGVNTIAITRTEGVDTFDGGLNDGTNAANGINSIDYTSSTAAGLASGIYTIETTRAKSSELQATLGAAQTTYVSSLTVGDNTGINGDNIRLQFDQVTVDNKATISAGSAYSTNANLTLPGLNVGTSVDITIDGTAYNLDKGELEAIFDGTVADGNVTAGIGAALNGVTALSTVADVTIENGKIVITSKSTGASSDVTFAITDGGGDLANVQTAFGITNGTTDIGNSTIAFTATLRDNTGVALSDAIVLDNSQQTYTFNTAGGGAALDVTLQTVANVNTALAAGTEDGNYMTFDVDTVLDITDGTSSVSGGPQTIAAGTVANAIYAAGDFSIDLDAQASLAVGSVNFVIENTFTATMNGADTQNFAAGATVNFANGVSMVTSATETNYSAIAAESSTVTVGQAASYTATIETSLGGAVGGAQVVTVNQATGGTYNIGNGVEFTLAAGALTGAVDHAFTVAVATATTTAATLTNTTTSTLVGSVDVTGGSQTADFGSGLTVDIAAATAGTATFAISGAVEDNSLTMQVGANQGQGFKVSVSDMRSEALGISSSDTGATLGAVGAAWTTADDVSNGTDSSGNEYGLDVSDTVKASAAIKVYDDAINSVSSERSRLGAFQNRLEHTINNLGTSAENLTAAESRIRDVDMAREMMEFTKNNILSQAAQSMLAQANQQPQGVLQLLR